MGADILFILFGIVLLVVGAELLVRGAAGLALKLGIPSLIVGLTVVALGTSAPELVIGIKSVQSDHGSLAIGAVVGSNTCNILFILGVAGLIAPLAIRESSMWIDVPVLSIGAIIIAYLAGVGVINHTWAVLLTIGICLYILVSIIRAVSSPAPQSDDIPNAPDKLWMLGLLIVAGLALLKFGGDFLLEGAISSASKLAVNEAIIGLTIVAVGSSLPELATAVSASLKGQGDLVIGNVLGSNIFNSFAILGISGLFGNIPYEGVSNLAIGFMLAATIILVPFMWTKFRLDRWEAFVMLVMFVSYLVAVVTFA